VNETKFCALILAAGKGTRMQSDKAKVLHELNGKPLLHYSIGAAKAAGAEKIVAVIGHQAERVRETFAANGCILSSRIRSWERDTLFCRRRMYCRIMMGLPLFFAATCRF